jgi:hypothetical protein
MKILKQLTVLLILTLVSTSSIFAFQKETRDLETFTEISLRTSANVYLTQGDTQKVEISGSQDDMDRLETKVRDGQLIIDTYNQRNSWSGLSDVDIYITVKTLEALAVAGSGDMVSRGNFKCDDLDISVAGSGDLEFETDAKNIDISIAGSGSVELKGSSSNNKVSIAGSGKLDAEELVANEYRISIAGSGKCTVHAKEEISSKITGSGSVYYKGDPKRVNNNSNGSGKIRKI